MHQEDLESLVPERGSPKLQQRVWAFVDVVLKGPRHPSEHIFQCKSSGYFSTIDSFPYFWRSRIPPFIRKRILVLYCTLWFLIFALLTKKNLYVTPEASDGTEMIQLSCRQNHDFWTGKNSACGINGDKCLKGLKLEDSEFSISEKDFIIKCPSLCDSEGRIFSTVTTGLQDNKYVTYIVGGGPVESASELTYPYRADSFPCAAALHSGLISSVFGGVARLSFQSSNDDIAQYPSTPGSNSMIRQSIEFNSTFPYSFVFKPLNTKVSNKYDLRFFIILLNFLAGVPIIYLFSGKTGYIMASIVGFWTIILASDPPLILDNFYPEVNSMIISTGFRRALPLAFTLYVIWEFVCKKTLSDIPTNSFASPIGKLVWYGLYWIGILNNWVFDRYMTIDRLLISDLKQQSASFLTIVTMLFLIGFGTYSQVTVIWKAGKLSTYLKNYGIVILCCFALNLIPGLTLRIHHYILGLILLPGTATKNFSAFAFQGLLLGLVINGVAKWDFSSIMETDNSLRRDDPSDLLDNIPPHFEVYDNGKISWDLDDGVIESASSVSKEKYEGFSLLVNDVERYRGPNTTITMANLSNENKEFENFLKRSLKATSGDVTLYLRVARASLDDSDVGDYTRAATLKWPSGKFEMPLEGRT